MKKEFIMPSMKIAGFNRESILTLSNGAQAEQDVKAKGGLTTHVNAESDTSAVSLARIDLQ